MDIKDKDIYAGFWSRYHECKVDLVKIFAAYKHMHAFLASYIRKLRSGYTILYNGEGACNFCVQGANNLVLGM